MRNLSPSRRPPDSTRPPARRGCRGVIAGLLLLAPAALAGSVGLCGCDMIGAAAYKFSGTPEIPAAYVPTQKSMLVWVEKSDNPGEVPLESERMARLIEQRLREQHVVPLVDASPVAELRSRDPRRYRTLTPAQAAHLAGARQVLYVDLVEFTVADALATELARGRVAARVRVIDADSGDTLWPLDTTQGMPLSVEDPYARTGSGQTAGALRQKMSEDLAEKIAKLFYKYKSNQIDGTEPRGGDLAR